MSTYNKIIITLASLCVVAVVAFVAVIAVYAATNQTVTSQINVSYAVKDIAGSVTASYTVGANGKSTTMGTVSFEPEDEGKETQAIPEGMVELTAQNNFVVFDYHFVNTMQASTKLNYVATLIYTDLDTDDTNIVISYSFNDVEGGVIKYTAYEYSSGAIGGKLVVAAGSEAHAYIKVGVKSNLENAKFNGEFKWTLAAKPQE